MNVENRDKLVQNLTQLDELAADLLIVFQVISTKHKIKGGYLEFVYLEHYLKEIVAISNLFQHLYKDKKTKKFLFLANRMLFEILLKSEYIIQLKNKGDNNKILSLMSKDVASAMAALDEAVDTTKNNSAKETLMNINVVNKILGTGFDLEKIKSNTKTFPDVKSLCNNSKLCLKDYCGKKLWHIYVEFSWCSHSRLGSTFHIEKHFDYEINYQTEFFIEIYLKNLNLLSGHSEAKETQEKISNIMSQIGIKFI